LVFAFVFFSCILYICLFLFLQDIKPANVLINADCSMKICDFGLSRSTLGPNATAAQKARAEEEIASAARKQREALANAPLPQQARQVSTEKMVAMGSLQHQPPPQKLARELTKHVVTRWYRAPEVILLSDRYTTAIDSQLRAHINQSINQSIAHRCSFYDPPHDVFQVRSLRRLPLLMCVFCFSASSSSISVVDRLHLQRIVIHANAHESSRIVPRTHMYVCSPRPHSTGKLYAAFFFFFFFLRSVLTFAPSRLFFFAVCCCLDLPSSQVSPSAPTTTPWPTRTNWTNST
jgi:serine/threonine protein kinase